MDLRAQKQTRRSLKDVAERLRSLLRYLQRTGRTGIDLSPHVIAPLLYAYEGVPSILERDQIAAVLESTSKDTTPIGLRDHAILQLLATYGMRSNEIRNLKIEDIDWRAESIRILLGGVEGHRKPFGRWVRRERNLPSGVQRQDLSLPVGEDENSITMDRRNKESKAQRNSTTFDPLNVRGARQRVVE